jgi:hypothetical protein
MRSDPSCFHFIIKLAFCDADTSAMSLRLGAGKNHSLSNPEASIYRCPNGVTRLCATMFRINGSSRAAMRRSSACDCWVAAREHLIERSSRFAARDHVHHERREHLGGARENGLNALVT